MSEHSASLLSISAWKQRLVFWLGAIIVGLLVVAMTLLSEWAAQIYRLITTQYQWAGFVLAPVGLSITVWLTYRFFPGSERSGIPQVKTALEIHTHLEERNRLLSLKIALGKMLLPILGLLSGASIGFGGPAVQVGASFMASLGKAVKFPQYYMNRGLILAGSAAGFAAMFSAPLAGIIFAIEEMGRALEEKISSLVLTAIVFSGVTAHAILHHYIFFHELSLFLPYDKSWLAVLLCGVIGGFLGSIFSFIITRLSTLIAKITVNRVLIAFICGVIIAFLGYLSNGDSVGTGYFQTKYILSSMKPVDPLFPVYKMLATCATFFSGIPSGIFVPSLATGAGFGANLAHWFPLASTSVMILLTMTAYFSGMLQSPLTAFVIVMEMTGGHEILIPLMATSFIASATSKLINPVPLYRVLCDAYRLPDKALQNGSDSEQKK